jgi:tubulin-specific chaperone A
MPAPSQLAIATSSLQRLTKEEASYHKELQMQQKRIDQLEKEQTEETDEDRGNHEFQLKQEVRAQMTDLHFLFSLYPSAHSQYHSF